MPDVGRRHAFAAGRPLGCFSQTQAFSKGCSAPTLMLVPQSHRWEGRRRYVGAGLVATSLSGFLLGGIFGLFVLPSVYPLVAAFGFALSRPVHPDPDRDRLLARLVYLACSAPALGLALLALQSGISNEANLPTARLELFIIWTSLAISWGGVTAAAIHTIRRRGSHKDARWTRYLVLVVAASGAWLLAFIVLDFFLQHPFQTVDLAAVGKLAFVPLAGAGLAHQGVAFWRIWTPAARFDGAPTEPPVALVRPVFRPFGRV
jgi:hypothetical protein